jgi:hypothetical protein
MPVWLKFIVSTAVAVVTIGGWFYMSQPGLGGPRWAAAVLGPFTIFSLWIFNDVMRNRADGHAPRHQVDGARS